MYTNKHAWTNKDGTYKEVYYYVCSRNRMVRGKSCDYKAMLKKTEIENYEAKLREVDINKARLENEIDTLPKIHVSEVGNCMT